MEISELLVRRRKELGITAAQAATRLKVSAATLSHWENGRNVPVVSKWGIIADFLGVDIKEIHKMVEGK